MNVQIDTSNENLAGALQLLGVRFLLGDQGEYSGLPPVRLIAALAQSTEARLRLALIPLFLERPEFAAHVLQANEQLPNPAGTTLRCYYTAAMLLQELHYTMIVERLGEQRRLPDLFSHDLVIPETGTHEARLEALARRQEILSGASVNWLGTYHHAVRTWLKGLRLAENPT